MVWNIKWMGGREGPESLQQWGLAGVLLLLLFFIVFPQTASVYVSVMNFTPVKEANMYMIVL